MKKKIGAMLLAGALACSVTAGLAGCGGGALPDFEMPEGGFDTEAPVEIMFYHSMGAGLQNILNENIKEFNKLYPNITVKTSFADYNATRDQIIDELVPNNQPNIATCYPDHVSMYNKSNAVLPLNDFLSNGAFKNEKITLQNGTTVNLALTAEEQAMYDETYFSEGYAFDDGKTMYTLPWLKSTEVLYYNKDFFEDHELEVPETWNDLEKLCEKIMKIDSSMCPFTYDSESNWFITMCEQYGSDYTSPESPHFIFDNETNRAFVAKFAEWYQKGWFTTQELNGGAYTSDLFVKGKSAMCIGSSGGATYQVSFASDQEDTFEVGITTIPQLYSIDPEHPDYKEGYKPKVISQGPSVCILKNDNPQEVLASWLFVKFMTTSIGYQAESSVNNGYVPVLKSTVMATNTGYMDYLAKANGTTYITAQAIKVAMAHTDYCYTSPAFAGSSEARDQVGALMKTVFVNPEKLDTAFRTAVGQCEFLYGD